MNPLSSTSQSEQAGASPADVPTSTTTMTTFFADRETLISFTEPPSASLAPYFSPFITSNPSSLVTTPKVCDSSPALLPPGLLRDVISSSKLITYTSETTTLAPSSPSTPPTPSKFTPRGRSRRGGSNPPTTSTTKAPGSLLSDVELSSSFGAVAPSLGTLVSLESDPNQIQKPRTPSSIKDAYEDKVSRGDINIQAPGWGGFIDRIKTGYFFGFFEAFEETLRNPEKKNTNAWYLRPSITFPLAFATVGLAFAVLVEGGGIRERGEMKTDELDNVVLQKDSSPKAKSIGEVIMEEAKKNQALKEAEEGVVKVKEAKEETTETSVNVFEAKEETTETSVDVIEAKEKDATSGDMTE